MVTSGGTVTSPTSTGGGGKQAARTPNSNGKKASPSLVETPPSSTTVGSHRPPETGDPLLMSIASKQTALVQQLITLTCYIPTNSVGAVIGRRGATIAQIQKQAQQVGTSNGAVRLSIAGGHHPASVAGGEMGATGGPMSPMVATGGSGDMQQQQQQQHYDYTLQAPQSPNPAQIEQSSLLNSQQQQQLQMTPLQSSATSVPYTYTELDWSSPLWTPVVIRADPCAALTAAQLLRDKVGPLDDIVMDVPLGRAKHAAVVGRRGYVLANLSADTHVRIMVPRRELRHDIIQLEGQLDKVKQCLERVLNIVSSDQTTGTMTTPSSTAAGSNSKKNNKGGNKADKHNTADTTSVVIKLAILPSQTKLRTIGRKSDTIIKKKKNNESTWDLTITGSSPQNVQSAVAILKKWSEDKDISNSNGNNNNNSTSASNDAINDNSDNGGNDAANTANASANANANANSNSNSKSNTNTSAKSKLRFRRRKPNPGKGGKAKQQQQ